MPEVAQGLGLLLWVWFLLYFLFPPIPQTVYPQESQPISFLQLRVNIFILDLIKEKVAHGQSEVLRGNAHSFKAVSEKFVFGVILKVA